MINAEKDKETGKCNMTIRGDSTTIAYEIAAIIKGAYCECREKDKKTARWMLVTLRKLIDLELNKRPSKRKKTVKEAEDTESDESVTERIISVLQEEFDD